MWTIAWCALLTTPAAPTVQSRELDCLPPHELIRASQCEIAVCGDTLLACGGDVAGEPSGPSVRVYRNRGGAWKRTGALPPVGRPTVRMGFAVDLHGDRAIVGGPFEDANPAFAGQAAIFKREGDEWRVEKLIEGVQTQSYGWDVAIAGDRAFITTPSGDRAGVDVFALSPEGWSLETHLEAPQGARDFGMAIDAGERMLVVSARASNRVYVYERESGPWRLSATLSDPDGAPTDWFGTSVAVENGRIVVGSPQFEDEQGTGRAAVFVREPDGAGWRLEGRLSAPDAARRDWFGASVAISGERIAVGAYGDDGPNGPTGPGSGSVYVFESGAAGWACTERVVAADAGRTTSFGNRVALAAPWLGVSSPDTPTADRGQPARLDAGCVFVHQVGERDAKSK